MECKMVDLRIQKLHEDMTLPHYAHPGDAGIDLRSAMETIIEPGTHQVVKAGIKMAIPQGFVGLIWDKSGYAAKHGIHVLAGVVDSGYRGEIGVVMMNLGKDPFKITHDQKIAQMLIQPVASAKISEVEDLEDTSRSEGGFGSTGTH